MTPEITQIIQACEWGINKFLVVSTNVFDPLIYYSHLLPFVITLALGLLIFFKNRKELVSRTLLTTIVFLSVWLIGDLILWATDNPRTTMFVWSVINMVEPFIYASVLYFLYVFFDKKDTSFAKKIWVAVLLLPTILLTPTSLALLGFDLTNCDRDAIEGPLVYYGYAIETVFMLWIIGFGIQKYIKAWKDKDERRKTSLVTLGSLGFLVAFAFGNVIGSLFDTYGIGGADYSWTIGQYGLFGIPVFIGLLSYIIVRYKAFNIKVLGTQTLVAALVLITGSELFFVTTTLNQILVAITLIISLFAGYFLIKGVQREVKQKEEIQKLANNLQRANTGLSEANSKLKELDKQKSEFVSFASHQLRSPMTAMKGYASMIVEGDYGPVPDIIKKPVSIIYESTQTLINIVEDYLNISRIELGTLRYNLANMNLSELAEQVVNEQRPNVENRGLKLELKFNPAEKYMVAIDKDKFKQILMNLVDNAVKYTPNGSITVELAKGKNSIQYIVKDTGIGIPTEIIPKLFQKWSRADNARTENIKGTGLGLFVAKQMTEAHQGKIWAESEGEGKGSRFIVELPEVK